MRLPGWIGSLPIDEAEKKLEGAQVGTYLIRTGVEVFQMIEEMKGEYGEIYPYSLLFAADEGKISELLILHVSWGWIIQNDEPNLKSESYMVFGTAKELLDSLHEVIGNPVSV
jgi:hypothetical protein